MAGNEKEPVQRGAHYTNDLVYSRLGPGILEKLQRNVPKNDKGYRPDRLHQWLTEDIGHPLLSQHMHSIMIFQRLAIGHGHGWKWFLLSVDQLLPKRGCNLQLPLGDPTALPPPS